MAEVDAKTRVHNAIQKDVLGGLPDGKKELAALAQAMVKIDQATKKDTDADMLATYRRELDAKTRAVAMVAETYVDRLKTLKDIADDEDDFEADSDEIEKAQDRLDKTKAMLLDWIVKAKKLDDRAKASVQQGQKSAKLAQREWDLLMANDSQVYAAQTSNVKVMRTAYQKCQKAVAERDAKTLADNIDMAGLVFEQQDMLDGKAFDHEVKAFMSKYDLASLDKELRDQIAKDKATLADQSKKLQVLFQEVKKMRADLPKLNIAPPDYVKVTAKLGFKANFNARVEKALKLDEARLAKELEAIGKDAGVKGTGKDFVAKLKKEGLYP